MVLAGRRWGRSGKTAWAGLISLVRLNGWWVPAKEPRSDPGGIEQEPLAKQSRLLRVTRVRSPRRAVASSSISVHSTPRATPAATTDCCTGGCATGRTSRYGKAGATLAAAPTPATAPADDTRHQAGRAPDRAGPCCVQCGAIVFLLSYSPDRGRSSTEPASANSRPNLLRCQSLVNSLFPGTRHPLHPELADRVSSSSEAVSDNLIVDFR